MFKNLIEDLKQRFLNFETSDGIYQLPVGLIGGYITFFHQQYILYAIGGAFFGRYVYRGVYLLWMNPIKKEAKKQVQTETVKKKLEKK